MLASGTRAPGPPLARVSTGSALRPLLFKSYVYYSRFPKTCFARFLLAPILAGALIVLASWGGLFQEVEVARTVYMDSGEEGLVRASQNVVEYQVFVFGEFAQKVNWS